MMGVVGGALLGSSGLLESLLADMAEDAQIDDSDMGQVFGIWKFAAKAARAVAIAFGGKVLAMIGYASTHEANQVLDPLVAQRIGILFGPVVGVLFVVGGVMAWRIFRPRSIPR